MKVRYLLFVAMLGAGCCCWVLLHVQGRGIGDDDGQVLLAFKGALSADPLEALGNWTIGNSYNQSFCNWEGVTCNDHKKNRRVTMLNVSDMQLHGTISSSIGNLTFLQSLDLSQNNFSGTIPPELGRCSNLLYVDLYQNQLRGTLPDSLGSLKSLEILILSDNLFEGGIPPNLFTGCLNLSLLSVSNNRFNENIPSELGVLQNLKQLYLWGNAMTGSIPASVSNCSALVALDLSVNRLTGVIPSEIGKLSNLQILNVFQNDLIGVIPSSLSNCTELVYFGGYENNLSGHIPVDLGQKLTRLQILYIYNNSLTGGIPSSLTNCSAMEFLDLSFNQLIGAIPSGLGSLTRLMGVSFAYNQLSGRIPTTIGNCSALAKIVFTGNELLGTVPLELGTLKHMDSIFLAKNHLSGSANMLLSALTNCSNLTHLELSSNNFSNTLTGKVGQFTPYLSYLHVDNNAISGRIPVEIGNLTGLLSLALHKNFFIGTVPATLGKLKTLQRLFLHNNLLTGNIPRSLASCTTLGELHIENNMLSGTIPTELGQLQQLNFLYLDSNYLTGSIPRSLADCTRLEALSLSYNRLNGTIPAEIASALRSLQDTLNLSHNLLSGSVPSELGGMILIRSIDMSNNHLAGVIPNTLDGCVELQFLDLSHNQLEGSIPQTIGDLISLVKLDLTFNNLTGSVPLSIAGIKTIIFLNFSFNNLEGEVPTSGIFRRLNSSSFLGNPHLCGSIYGIPACERLATGHSHKKKRIRGRIKIAVICLAAGILLLILAAISSLLLFSNRNKDKKNSEDGTVNEHYMRMTAQELSRATDGCSNENLLGTSNLSSVYKAVLHDGRTVAIKILKLGNHRAKNSFNRECYVLSRVRHRNLVKIIGLCSNLEIKALVLEFMVNGNLDKQLHEAEHCQMSWDQRLQIAIDIAQGMVYLHHECEEPIVHCDLKPANVLLDEDMVAHVADFGIARLLKPEATSAVMSTSGIVGSVGYIAPEYAHSTRISTKGDVYSYGILLLELLTGRRPSGDTFAPGGSLARWAHECSSNGTQNVLDPFLLQQDDEGSSKMQEMNHFLKVALLCSRRVPAKRPTMKAVREMLLRIKNNNARVSSTLEQLVEDPTNRTSPNRAGHQQ